MKCEEIRTVIPRYMAGESEAAEAVAIEEHLGACKQCSAELKADQRVDACLRDAMLEDEPDVSPVVRHVVTRLEHAPWWQQYFSVGTLRFAAVGAMVVLIFFIGRGVYVHEAETNIAMAAAHDHYMDLLVLKRTDWAYSGAPSTVFVKANFPETPDLVQMITPAGALLEKVRLCNLKGTHYAHFVFHTPQGDVSVFLRKARGGDTYKPGNVRDRSNGLEVAGFSSQSFVGAVVGQGGLVPAGEIAAQESRAL